MLLLVIGVAVTEVAVRGRREHTVAARRAGYLDGINDTARSVAEGHAAGDLIEQVQAFGFEFAGCDRFIHGHMPIVISLK